MAIGTPMWEYNQEMHATPDFKEDTRFAYQLRPGNVIKRENACPLRVQEVKEDYRNNDVVLTVRMRTFRGTWGRVHTMRVGILAKYTIESD